jgi:elongation factor 1-gamma
MGKDQYNKKNVDEAAKATGEVMAVFEDHFLLNTYLVGERITLADIFCAAIVGRGYEMVFDAEWRKGFPNVTRWYQTIANQSAFKEVAGEPKLIAEAIKYTPPKKDEKPKAEAKKEAPKPKAAKPKEDDDEDDEPKEAPKPKHPIEALGKPTFALDDWKRKYKNEETREVALPWFWENMNFEEYSIWSVDYKYNDELTQTFMTSNLIGGFFTRLEASRKYIMGCASVYGEANDSIVKGAFVIRGKDALQAFDVAPDWESYEFKQLDPKSSEHKEFVDSMWAWDKPITVEGKDYKWADGKIFV